jgi:hypothetical protein
MYNDATTNDQGCDRPQQVRHFVIGEISKNALSEVAWIGQLINECPFDERGVLRLALGERNCSRSRR